jgi:PII-like signaling protein
MQGYQLTFFTQQDRTHGHISLGEWLVKEANKLGIGGATLIAASEGFGHDHKLHSARFFEFSDQPVEVTMAVTDADAKRIFQRLRDEKLNVFYVKTPIEFGMSDDAD